MIDLNDRRPRWVRELDARRALEHSARDAADAQEEATRREERATKEDMVHAETVRLVNEARAGYQAAMDSMGYLPEVAGTCVSDQPAYDAGISKATAALLELEQFGNLHREPGVVATANWWRGMSHHLSGFKLLNVRIDGSASPSRK